MRFLSVCSGIEAASEAGRPLGWQAAAFSEIDPFPCAVLAHHYPDVPNFGDLTRYQEWPDVGPVDVLVGGTPCQSFSVAGLRGGMADPRGNLALVFLGVVDRYRPRWVVWENVPGVLSSNGGRDFGAFLGGLGECGYGFAYRVLDAQYFGLAQRRKRVFVVGHLGSWQRAAAVLLERAGLRGDPAPRREAGEGVAAPIAAGSPGGSGYRNDADTAKNLVSGTLLGGGSTDGSHRKRNGSDAPEMLVTHPLRADGFDASEDGTGRGTPLVSMALNAKGGTGRMDAESESLVAETLRGHPRPGSNALGATVGVGCGMQVRRLTPRECERLQGFPDDYTSVPYHGKPAADGPRYKALGNSMAVPVVRWLFARIEAVTRLGREWDDPQREEWDEDHHNRRPVPKVRAR